MWKTIVGLILIGYGIHVIRGDAETPGSVGGGVIFILFGLGFVFFGYILPLLKQRIAYKKWLQRNYSATMQEVDQMTGVQFEDFCAALLQKHGYNVTFTKASGDQGVDIIAQKDGIRYAIQCKRYDNVLSNKSVQEVYTGSRIYKCDIPVVMTNSYFSSGAIEAARATGVKLWNRDKIIAMHSGEATH